MMGKDDVYEFCDASERSFENGVASRRGFQVTVCDPLCEVDIATSVYVQSRARENGFVEYFQISRRGRGSFIGASRCRDSAAGEVGLFSPRYSSSVPLA